MQKCDCPHCNYCKNIKLCPKCGKIGFITKHHIVPKVYLDRSTKIKSLLRPSDIAEMCTTCHVIKENLLTELEMGMHQKYGGIGPKSNRAKFAARICAKVDAAVLVKIFRTHYDTKKTKFALLLELTDPPFTLGQENIVTFQGCRFNV